MNDSDENSVPVSANGTNSAQSEGASTTALLTTINDAIAAGGGSLVLTVELLPECAPILESLQVESLTIENAVTAPESTESDVLVTGTTTFLSVEDMTAALTLVATGDTVQIKLDATLPVSWNWSQSFPSLPASFTAADDVSTALIRSCTMLDGLTYQDPHFVSQTYEEGDLQVGLNFTGTPVPNPLLLPLAQFGVPANCPVAGPIVLPDPEDPNSYPDILLFFQAQCAAITIMTITVNDVRCRLHTARDSAVSGAETRLEVSGAIPLGSDLGSADVVAPLYQRGSVWEFTADFDDPLPVPDPIALMVTLAGGDPKEYGLPQGVSLAGLGISRVIVSFDLSNSILWSVGLIVVSEQDWTIAPGIFSLGNFTIGWLVNLPFTDRTWVTQLAGTLEFGGKHPVSFDVVLNVSDDLSFTVDGDLSADEVLSVTDFLENVFSVDANLPALDVSTLSVSYDSSGTYSIYGASSSVWTIPLGICTLEGSNLTATIGYDGAKTVGSIGGSIAIGDNRFDINYVMPDVIRLSGVIQNTSLKQLTRDLLGDLFTYPAEFPDISLTDITIEMNIEGSNYQFEFISEVSGWGTLDFKVQYLDGKWGVLAGFALPANFKLSSLGSCFASFDSLVFSTPALVISSFDDPSYAFPGAVDVAIPNGVIEGINFYCSLSLKGGALGQVASLLGCSTIDVAMALPGDFATCYIMGTPGGSAANGISIPTGSNLIVSLPKLYLYPFTPYLVQIGGSMTIPVGSQSVLVNVALTVTADSLSFTGSAETSAMSSPMGFQGIHLNEIGVELGMIFEPPSFTLGLEGQFAIGDQPPSANMFAFEFELVGELVNPLLLECKFAEVDLPIIFEACMDATVTLPAILEGVRFNNLFVYWCEAPTALPDGTIAMPGYAVSGETYFYGWTGKGGVFISFTTGMNGSLEMDPIVIPGVLSLTNADGTGGAGVQFNTAASPFFAISCAISVINTPPTVISGEIDPDGFAFTLASPGGVITDRLTCSLKMPTDFSFSTTMGVGVDLTVGPLTLPGSPIHLGSVHVQGGFTGTLGCASDLTSFTGTIAGGVSWDGQNWSIPNLVLHLCPSTFDDFGAAVLGWIEQEASTIFAALFNAVEEWATNVAAGIITGVEDVGVALKDAYNQTANQAVALMNSMGQTADQVGHALKDAYQLADQTAADVCSQVAYAADSTATYLKNVYNVIDPTKCADIMATAGYTQDQTAQALKSVYNASAAVATAAMKEAYHLSDEAASAVLEGVGYAADEVNKAIKDLEKTGKDIEKKLNPKHW